MTRNKLRTLGFFLVATSLVPAAGCTDRANDQAQLDPRTLHAFEDCEDMMVFTKAHAIELIEAGAAFGGYYGWDEGVGVGETGGDFGGEDGAAGTSGGDDGGTGGGDGGVDNGGSQGGDGGGEPGVDYSETNVQEAGVDEPDVLKTDGTKILAITGQELVYVDVSGMTPAKRGTLELPNNGWNYEMFIEGDKVLVLGHADNYDIAQADQPDEWTGEGADGYGYVSTTRLVEIDVSNPDDMRTVRILDLAGDYVSARMVDGVARVVLRSQPVGLDFKDPWEFYDDPYWDEGGVDEGDWGGTSDGADWGDEPGGTTTPGTDTAETGDTGDWGDTGWEGETGDVPIPEPIPGTGGTTGGTDGGESQGVADWDQAIELAKNHNIQVVQESEPENWLPQYVLQDLTGNSAQISSGLVYDCDQAMRPGEHSGLDVLSVVTVDLGDDLGIGSGVGVFASGDTVYASTENLYVATHAWWTPPLENLGEDDGHTVTHVHKFDISDKASTSYRASGDVRGYLLSQWSMSEKDGNLRVASTDWTDDWSNTESFVTVMSEDEEGGLDQLGQVGGLGEGEEIYAVRFIGDVGYVVTFRQVDPLYTIDLSDPAQPVTRGELKINGYSAYLHPAGEGLLIGVGYDGTEEGQITNLQASLFDVSDLDNPVRLHAHDLGDGWSEATYDHRAFLYWGPEQTLILPTETYFWDEQTFEEGIIYQSTVLHVDADDGFTHQGNVTHPMQTWDEYWGYAPQRSAIVGPLLYTSSSAGMMASELDGLAEVAWIDY